MQASGNEQSSNKFVTFLDAINKSITKAMGLKYYVGTGCLLGILFSTAPIPAGMAILFNLLDHAAMESPWTVLALTCTCGACAGALAGAFAMRASSDIRMYTTAPIASALAGTVVVVPAIIGLLLGNAEVTGAVVGTVLDVIAITIVAFISWKNYYQSCHASQASPKL